ncbi:MAG: hypothetical protein J7L45_01705, partial [Candidatus Aenigmarchaeota archaeon]|nr:hypothetical protein [Candidatus Aenigmarchaeota archaeon]
VDSPIGMVEWVALGGGYVKAVPVFVKIKVPRNISEITRNYHVIKVMVKATTEKPTSSGIKEQISQAREFYYAVTIPGNVNAKTQEEYENSLKLEKFYEEYERIKNGINNESYGGYSKFNVKHPDETQSGGEERKINFPTGFFTLKNQEEGGGYLIYVMLIIVILLLLIYFIRKR